MAVSRVRLLQRGSTLFNFAKRGIPGYSPVLTSPSYIARHVSSYFNSIFPVDDQTLIKDGPERIRVIRRNEEQFLPTQQFSDVTTIYEGFQRGKRVSNDGPLLGCRSGPNKSYQWLTFSQVEERARLFGSGLVSLGIAPGSESFVGIFSTNRPEWTITDLACILYSMVSVPLYASLGKSATVHIANQTNMCVLVCDTLMKAETLLEDTAAITGLKNVVVMDLPSDGADEIKRRFDAVGLRMLSFNDVISKGTANLCDPVIPKPSDLNSVVYTSGTTGIPKGVPLTNRHYIVNHAQVHATFDVGSFSSPSDRHLSYLPLAHVYERTTQYHAMFHGTPMGYFQGDLALLMDDFQTLRPTLLFGVPRVYNKIYHQVMRNVTNSSSVKRAIFNFAYQQKLKDLQRGTMREDSLWDKLVFKKIQDIFGGRIRLMFSGAAPLSAEVATFYRVVMGCPCYEGYGQTETTTCIAHTIETDMTSGHVGIPGADTQIKLVDVPELKCFAEDDVGEVCVKGGNVFTGYFKEPERTKEALDEDGWLHTGDIGRWNKNGTLSIIDRKKHILKLAQGLYVAPEKVENVYVRLPLLTQVFVYGDSLRSYVIGIVIPDPQELEKFGKHLGVTGSVEELCRNEKVTDAVLKALQKQGSADGLQGFEQVQAIHLHPEAFSEQNGLLTPTLKSKRSELNKAFKDQIDEIYRRSDKS